MGKQGGKNTPVVTKPQYHGQKRKKTEDSDEEVDFPKKICRKYQKSIEEINSSSENDSSDNEESDSEESEGPGDQVQDKSQGIGHKHLNRNRTKSIKQNMNEYISSKSDDNNDDHSGKDTRDIDKSTKIDEYISSESDNNDDSDVTDDDEEDEEDKLQEGTILKNVSGIKLHNIHRTTTKQFDSVMDQNDGSESLSSYDDDSEDSSDDDNSIDIVDDGDHEAVKDELRKRSKLKEVITGKGHVTNSVETKDMQNINKPIIEESKSSSESESSDNEESDVGSDCQVPNKTQSGENENDRTKQFINKEIDEYISSESDDNSDDDDDDDDDDVTVDLKLPTSTKLKIVSNGDLIDSPVTKCLENMDKQLNTKHSSSADGMSSDSSGGGDSEASEDQINDNNDVKGNSSIDDDEVETAGNAEPEDDFAAVKKELANIPLEDLMKIKEKLGLKTFYRIMHGDKFEEKKQKVFKRENKNRPMELSSKKRVPVIRQGDVAKEKVSRDPRFDDLSGEFQDRHFMKNYSFLDDIKSKEKLLVQKKMNKTKDESKKKDLAKLLSKMNQQEQIEEKKKQKLELEQQWKEKERQLVKEGKAPYFLKKSEQKKLELTEKFKQLQKSGKVDQYMSKKLKKNAQKEKKKLPDRHQRFM